MKLLRYALRWIILSPVVLFAMCVALIEFIFDEELDL